MICCPYDFSYFSDTSDLSRNPNENASVSPIPPNSNVMIEVDAVNNNRQAELATPRICCVCSSSSKYEHGPCLSVNGRRHCYDTQTTIPVDSQLSDWLIKHNIDKTSRDIILNEQFSFVDFVYHMEKSDLHRIGLKYVQFAFYFSAAFE